MNIGPAESGQAASALRIAVFLAGEEEPRKGG
jgi:hypothetical protein